MKQRVVLGESRLRARRRKQRLFVFGGSFACLVLIFLLVWWFCNASFLAITHVEVSGTNAVPATAVEQAVRTDMTGSYAWLFAKSNVFLYPKKTIEANLLAQYPTFKSVGVRAKDFHTLAVVAVERVPFALWCGAAPIATSTCMLLDAGGVAYAEAPQYSGDVYKKYFGALSTTTQPRQFLTESTFHSLSALALALEKKNAPDSAEQVTVDEHSDVRVHFSGGYELLFAGGDDSGDVFSRFSLTLTAAPFTTHPLSDFEYIDLRFGDKVYYKLKNQ